MRPVSSVTPGSLVSWTGAPSSRHVFIVLYHAIGSTFVLNASTGAVWNMHGSQPVDVLVPQDKT